MSKVNIESPFISYTFDSEDEARQAMVLGDLNRQMVQNLLFKAVMEKVALLRTPETSQREAELQGEIGVLQFILANHATASEELVKQVRENSNPTTGGEYPIHQIFPPVRMGGGNFDIDDSSI